jgi:hypothetical protein
VTGSDVFSFPGETCAKKHSRRSTLARTSGDCCDTWLLTTTKRTSASASSKAHHVVAPPTQRGAPSAQRSPHLHDDAYCVPQVHSYFQIGRSESTSRPHSRGRATLGS